MPLDPVTASMIINGVGAGLGALGQSSANKTNIKIAQENRDFQERMSSTAYQRATADKIKAGINPLFGIAGGGASTPSGSVAQVQSDMESLSRASQGQLSSAIEAKKAKTQQKSMENQNKLLQEQRKVAQSTAQKQKAETANLNAMRSGILSDAQYKKAYNDAAIPAFDYVMDKIKSVAPSLMFGVGGLGKKKTIIKNSTIKVGKKHRLIEWGEQ